MSGTVAMICPSCATRYARLTDPDCLLCQGRGTLVLQTAGGDPWSVARALEMHLGYVGDDDKRRHEAVRTKIDDLRRFLAPPVSFFATSGERNEPSDSVGRQRKGTAASALLVAMGLKTRPKRAKPVKKPKSQAHTIKANVDELALARARREKT